MHIFLLKSPCVCRNPRRRTGEMTTGFDWGLVQTCLKEICCFRYPAALSTTIVSGSSSCSRECPFTLGSSIHPAQGQPGWRAFLAIRFSQSAGQLSRPRPLATACNTLPSPLQDAHAHADTPLSLLTYIIQARPVACERQHDVRAEGKSTATGSASPPSRHPMLHPLTHAAHTDGHSQVVVNLTAVTA